MFECTGNKIFIIQLRKSIKPDLKYRLSTINNEKVA